MSDSTTDFEVLSDFREGVKFFKVKNYDVAVEFFTEVCSLVGSSDPNYNRYRSWLGLTQAMMGDQGGLILCRLAAKEEASDCEVFVNLAKAEHRFGDLGKALRALEQGRVLGPQHPEIQAMLAKLDRRRRPALPFLSRNHFLNKLLGRLMRRSDGDTEKATAS